MNVVVEAYSFIRIEVMSLGCENEILCKLRIAVEGAHTLYNGAEINVEGLPTNNYLLALENRSSVRKLLVDYLIKLLRVLVRKTQGLCNL